MRLELNAEELDLRDAVRQFLASVLPAGIRDKVRQDCRLGREELTEWYRLLDTRGWATPRWPREAGGTGWTEAQHAIFDEELQLNDAPRMVSPGIMMLGPTLLRYGSEEQKARYLPGIRSSATWWAQGFSESEAGSDLASVRTTAKLRDSGADASYLVTGRKLWTSYAHFCDMMFCLTRTGSASDRPQQALTLLLLDMKAPGVSVRRLRTLDGGEDLNEVTLDGVRVPVANRVGAEGEGWTYAKYLLSFERGGIAGVGSAKKLLQRLGALDAGSPGGRAAVRVLRDDVHRMRVEVLALEATANRLLTQLPSDPTTPSILKVRGTELRQELSRLILQHGQAADICSAVAGAGTSSAGGPPKPNPALAFLDMRKLSIYGGTNEIQRNIIAKQIFRD